MDALVDAFLTRDGDMRDAIGTGELEVWMKSRNYDDAFVQVRLEVLPRPI